MKKEEPKVEVPLGGYYETWKASEANELIMSGEWREKQVCTNGKFILVRTKVGR